MVELRTLHFTDIQDHYERVAIVSDFLKEHGDVDAVFFTGDVIEANPTGEGLTGDALAHRYGGFIDQHKDAVPGLVKALQEQATLQREFKERGISTTDQLSEAEKQKWKDAQQNCGSLLEKLVGEREKEFQEALLPAVHHGYLTANLSFTELAEQVPVYGILGNHDLVIGYEHLQGSVTFVERERKATVKGKNGVEFTVKGDLNTWEVPPFYMEPGVHQVLSPHFIPYISGESRSTLEGIIRTTEGEKNKKARDHEVQVQEWQAGERRRLGSTDDVDIYFTHKLPTNDKAGKRYGDVSGEITREYSASAKAVYGGHFHDGQMGVSPLSCYLQRIGNREFTETTTIDHAGQQWTVPVFKLEADEPWHINPGDHHFVVTEYDAEKNVERVILYAFGDKAN